MKYEEYQQQMKECSTQEELEDVYLSGLKNYVGKTLYKSWFTAGLIAGGIIAVLGFSRLKDCDTRFEEKLSQPNAQVEVINERFDEELSDLLKETYIDGAGICLVAGAAALVAPAFKYRNIRDDYQEKKKNYNQINSPKLLCHQSQI
jgi:hypothetical protein